MQQPQSLFEPQAGARARDRGMLSVWQGCQRWEATETAAPPSAPRTPLRATSMPAWLQIYQTPTAGHPARTAPPVPDPDGSRLENFAGVLDVGRVIRFPTAVAWVKPCEAFNANISFCAAAGDLPVNRAIYEIFKQVAKSPEVGPENRILPPRRLLVKRRRGVTGWSLLARQM
ncbi:hypothetical protein GGX14DRAFT_386907 [Mycena pura]|uniref:Uncharacterized protein n=1 Tax=Mycena pura TaxID=153505 RepID=A0AAD7E2F0_9AGAR|nr:hypothetical protein GGX14DRAFT_386907 [Mycena pura]